MNNGSIETRSAASSAAGLAGMRFPTTDGSTRSTMSSERFDSIFDFLQRRSGSSSSDTYADLPYSGNEAASGMFGVTTLESTPGSIDDAAIHSEEDESTADDLSEILDESSPSLDDDIEFDTEMEPQMVEHVPEQNKPVAATKKTETKDSSESVSDKGKNPQNPVNSSSEVVKISSSLSIKLQQTENVKTTTSESEKKSLSATESKVKSQPNGADTLKTAASENAKVKTSEIQPSVDIAKTSKSDKIPHEGLTETVSKLKSNKTTQDQSGIATDTKGKPQHFAKMKVQDSAKVKVQDSTKMESTQSAETEKKESTSPAKTSSVSAKVTSAADAELLKNSLKTEAGTLDFQTRTQVHEIGIKVADQVVSKMTKVATDIKTSESGSSEKGFLKDSADSVAGNRSVSVNNRSDAGGFSDHNQQSGQNNFNDNRSSQDHSSYRQWVESNSEVKGLSQAMQQTELVDRAVSSVLSARVMNQIVNHIEKMRDSDKNRVKVSLGSDLNGVTVDIRIEGDAIYTTFEGDSDILDQLKEEWSDIKDRASRKGVILNDPEYISYSSSSEGVSFLPDVGIEKEEKSQSVIQHINNQPVRPDEMTAAAGSSGPVHSYA